MNRLDSLRLSIPQSNNMLSLVTLCFISLQYRECSSVPTFRSDNVTSLEEEHNDSSEEFRKTPTGTGTQSRNLYPMMSSNSPFIPPYSNFHSGLMFPNAANQGYLNPLIRPTDTSLTSTPANIKKDKRGGGKKSKISDSKLYDSLETDNSFDDGHATLKKQLDKDSAIAANSNEESSSVALLDPKSKTDDGDARNCPVNYIIFYN